MRHLFPISLIAISSIFVLSCQESLVPQEAVSGYGVLEATFEAQPSTRTSLSGDGSGSYKVLWSKGDNISVFPDAQELPSLYCLTEGEGTVNGIFEGHGIGSRYLAYYPGNGAPARVGENELSVVFPVEQSYAEGTFDEGICPMVASSSGSTLVFRNLASILKLSVTGRHIVTKVVFKPNDIAMKVSGQATVSVADPGAPVMTISQKGTDSLFLNTGNLVLSETQATDLYLVVPPGSYKGGFTVRIITTSGYADKTYSSDFTMERSKVHQASEFYLKLDGGIEVSSELEGLGTPAQPFLISSLSDLLLMQFSVNSPYGTVIRSKTGADVIASKASYKLTTDIDLSQVCGNDSRGSWTPIGNPEHPLLGSFDGGGHSVSNLYINAGSAYHQGLFGYVCGDLTSLDISGVIEDSNGLAGLLAGECLGAIKDCSSSGSVKSRGDYTGGLVGAASEPISGCSNHADILIAANWISYTGGVAGFVDGSVTDCLNDGNVDGDDFVGGICGEVSNGIVNNCVNYGNCNGRARTCAGIVGTVIGYVVNCVNYGSVAGSGSFGGIVGSDLGGVFNCANFGSISSKGSYCGGIAGSVESSLASSLANCVSTASFLPTSSFSDTPYIKAGICGHNVKGTVSNSYWLADPDATVKLDKAIGVDESESFSLFGLTPAQMKGGSYGEPLYKSYTTILEALNAWVVDNPVLEEYGINLKRWKYDGKTGYPTLE